MKNLFLTLLLLMLLLTFFAWSIHTLVDAAGDTLNNVRIIVTATPTPAFEWYEGCSGYCPTPCNCWEF